MSRPLFYRRRYRSVSICERLRVTAALFVVVFPVKPLAVPAAVEHEAAPGAGRELGDACATFNAAAVATCLDFRGGNLLIHGHFGGRLGRGHQLGWGEEISAYSSDKSRGILSYLNGAYRSGIAEGAAQKDLAQFFFMRKAGG